MTPIEILDLPMEPNESGADSIRGYLVELVATVWREGEGFSGKRPFGDSGWQSELYKPLVTAGLVRAHPNGCGWGGIHPDDRKAASQLIQAAIYALMPTAGEPA